MRTLILAFLSLWILSRWVDAQNVDGSMLDVGEIKMFCRVSGEGHPVFFIHPNGGDLSVWINQENLFNKHFKIVLADSRGHGRSESGDERLTYENITNDWLSLMDQLKIESASIVGWSDGGIVALMMAIKAPERVSKIVSIGGNLNSTTEAVNSYAPRWVKGILDDLDRVEDSDYPTGSIENLKQKFRMLIEQPEIKKESLSMIESPSLIISGDRDIIRLEHTFEIFKGIPRSNLCVLPGTTHWIPYEEPDLMNHIIFSFLTREFRALDSGDVLESISIDQVLSELDAANKTE